jgi:hypothetical protein
LVTEDGWHAATNQPDDQFQIRLSARMIALAHEIERDQLPDEKPSGGPR